MKPAFVVCALALGGLAGLPHRSARSVDLDGPSTAVAPSVADRADDARSDTSYVTICVVHPDGRLEDVMLKYRDRGDSTYDGVPLREAFPAGPHIAAGAEWFEKNELITFDGVQMARYGLSRVLGSTDVVNVGRYRGVLVFAEPTVPRPRQVIYVPVSSFCEFQAYENTR